MRAKFVNEKFKQESDPIEDIRIGYGKRQLNSKTWKVLEFIKSKREEGASFTEIQFFIWVLNGNDPKEFWKKSEIERYSPSAQTWIKTYTRKTRGYWNTQLYGAGGLPYYAGVGSHREHKGILNKYCKKNDKGKWVFVRYPLPKERFYKED